MVLSRASSHRLQLYLWCMGIIAVARDVRDRVGLLEVSWPWDLPAKGLCRAGRSKRIPLFVIAAVVQ